MERQFNATIAQKITITPELIILRIIPDDWVLPDFKAGQYAVIGLPGTSPRIQLSDVEPALKDPDKFILRAYSIASPSRQKEYLELYVALVRSGSLTPRLFHLESGDMIYLAPKIKGVFTVDEIPHIRNIVMMATGTGLAPYMSMIRSCIGQEPSRRFAIVHGARHSWDLGYRSELITISHIARDFTYIPIISRPNEEVTPWGGQAGYVQDIWNKKLIDGRWGFTPTPDDTHIFLCGNPGMILAAADILDKHGFREHSRREPGQVHIEKYW